MKRPRKARYPIGLEVRFHTLNKKEVFTGSGRTLDISSTGVWVSSAQQVSSGVPIELRMDWPLLLDHVTPLQLVILGRVSRCDDTGFAVAIKKYQFRTRRRRPLAEPRVLRAAG